MSDRLTTLAALKDGTYAPLKLLASEMSDRRYSDRTPSRRPPPRGGMQAPLRPPWKPSSLLPAAASSARPPPRSLCSAVSRAEPFDVRLAALRKKLTSAGNLADLAASNSLTAGVELLTTLFADKDAQV